MSTKTKKEEVVNNSNNLPEVEVMDATTTKGKVSSKFNLVETAKAEEAVEKIDKNKLFSYELADYFCPVKFDSSTLETNLQPLVNSGILSADAMTAAIEKAKKEFMEANSETIEKANNLSFADVLAKLQENQTLYKKVLTACNVSAIEEANYIVNGKVCIYRANQCQDKDGGNRYEDVTLKKTENGKEFSVSLFAEYRDVTTANILLSIRYYQSKLDATKRLFNQISDYRRILVNVAETAKKAKDNGFSKEQVIAEIEKVFAES